jgi:DNA topoisomerase-1
MEASVKVLKLSAQGLPQSWITLEQAVELLSAKASSGKAAGRKPGAKKPAAKKPAAKAPAAKAPAAKKAPATTKTGRLRASAVRVIRAADS